jgi:hypothetical protein
MHVGGRQVCRRRSLQGGRDKRRIVGMWLRWVLLLRRLLRSLLPLLQWPRPVTRRSLLLVLLLLPHLRTHRRT